METGIVTTKGQVVIPSRIRHRYRIKKGTRVCFIERGEEIVLKPVTDDYIDHLRGSLGSSGQALKALLAEKERERKL
ncbi:MAG: AbrB/MazE/SpoVT family DNA-binding domain-containing protein [Elusimicrobia bacterium]|nr:AbrB/MazE/SpoVT family DNA-binding domain-containing protein [Elusimicrobiota bacterium]